MTDVLIEETIEILDGRNFATLSTVNSDGSPQSSVVWILREGDEILMSVLAKRLKVRNIAREPRVSLALFDLANPYRSVEIRGTARLDDDPEKTLSYRVSHKYLGQDPPPEPAELKRVIIRVTPTKVTYFSA